ncbi:hypothetical protein AC1031_007252 [Aphanomyces cochlioides]|nr:hypothetical protein AC1031_007252 [Aphanomyces cochlioides]
MSWVEAWRSAELQVDLARGTTTIRQDSDVISIVQGERITVLVRVLNKTKAEPSTLSREMWFKNRSSISATFSLQSNEQIVVVQSVELDLTDRMEQLELQAVCPFRVDTKYLDETLRLSVQLKIDAAAGAFQQVLAKSSFDAIDAAVLDYGCWPDSLPSPTCFTRNLEFARPLRLFLPLSASHAIHGSSFDPASCLVLELTNTHLELVVTLESVIVHVSEGVEIISQEPPCQSFPTNLSAGESFQVICLLCQSSSSDAARDAVATVKWRLAASDASQTLVEQHVIPLRQRKISSVSQEPMYVIPMGMELSARWIVPEEGVVMPGVPFKAHVQVTNYSEETMDLILLLPWHQYKSIPAAAAGNARLLALASQWIDKVPQFISEQATISIGIVESGCSAEVAVTGTASSHGRIQIEHAMIYDRRCGVFYRQDDVWEFVAIETNGDDVDP